ncbi:MAG: hypothetical protein FJ304_15965 [Planctomycetes bacterium]|nr:hypothetical protein [Planctomycetota bacterium]
MIGQIVVMFVVLLLISTVVGAVAKMLNNLAEANAARRAEDERKRRVERNERAAERAREAQDERAERPARPAPVAPRTDDRPAASAAVRPANTEMDRFLAEIDRLRRKQAAAPDPPTAAAPVAPVVQPVKPTIVDQPPKRRTVAALADSPPPLPAPTGGFSAAPQAPTRSAPVAAQVEVLPTSAPTVRPLASSTGAPATKVTRFSARPRPAAKSEFGKNLTTLLGTGQGVAMAVVLQEILGPPKSRQKS